MRQHRRFGIYRNLMLSVVLCLVAATDAAFAIDLIGYVPYYRMSSSYNTNTLPAQLAMLDEVRYFGLTAASNGTITPLENTMSYHTNNINTIKNIIAALPADDRPRLNITLGGAGQASSFATIAAKLRSTHHFCSEHQVAIRFYRRDVGRHRLGASGCGQ